MATYDVAAFQTNINSPAPVPQELWDLAGGDGMLITGIVKLCQMFLLEIFTVRGSMPFEPDRGSSLLTFVRTGKIRSDIDAHVYFQYAVQEVKQNLIAEEDANTPDDERLSSVEVLSVAFTYEQLTYRVKLNSVAGSSRVVSVPLTTTP